MRPTLFKKRSAMALVLAAALLATAAAGLWQAWAGTASPMGLRISKPITIVVTFPPGGGTDLLARRLGERLQQHLGQPVVVENRPGASGNIGARQVAESPADGSTLLMVNSTFSINPAVYQNLGFDPERDFRAVFNAGTIASALVVPVDSSWHDLSNLIAASDRQSGASTAFASCGNGTPQHLAAEQLGQAAQLPLLHIPFKGCGPAVAAVTAGQVPLAIVTISSALPLVQAGRLHVLAVTAPQRLPQLPDVPTVAEQGVPGFAAQQWHGLLAPAGTPDAVVQQLHQTLQAIVAEPLVAQSLQAQSYQAVRQSPAQFGVLIRSDISKYRELAQSLGLRVD
ncbi:MAG: tripartite tricarboxylate transporter substrate binding protein [Comamonas sp.]